ncbi:hypothetical protein BDA99DRAFT_542811 [Phascolomyces articulosus]|uniref:Uncharacterized protein n=1 Tax=Phascolomyces articulosus TaxID=60185 RepID=A0AAD5P8D6_9FUNG|nr:hypothetical protein BDA99DRAFT_542811 [Phascolomyces articulosus]
MVLSAFMFCGLTYHYNVGWRPNRDKSKSAVKSTSIWPYFVISSEQKNQNLNQSRCIAHIGEELDVGATELAKHDVVKSIVDYNETKSLREKENIISHITKLLIFQRFILQQIDFTSRTSTTSTNPLSKMNNSCALIARFYDNNYADSTGTQKITDLVKNSQKKYILLALGFSMRLLTRLLSGIQHLHRGR